MPRWYGYPHVCGRAGRAAMLWSLRRLLELFPAAVVLVRTHPSDDEYDMLVVEGGDPAICEALVEDYCDLLPDGVAGGDEDEDDEVE